MTLKKSFIKSKKSKKFFIKSKKSFIKFKKSKKFSTRKTKLSPETHLNIKKSLSPRSRSNSISDIRLEKDCYKHLPQVKNYEYYSAGRNHPVAVEKYTGNVITTNQKDSPKSMIEEKLFQIEICMRFSELKDLPKTKLEPSFYKSQLGHIYYLQGLIKRYQKKYNDYSKHMMDIQMALNDLYDKYNNHKEYYSDTKYVDTSDYDTAYDDTAYDTV